MFSARAARGACCVGGALATVCVFCDSERCFFEQLGAVPLLVLVTLHYLSIYLYRVRSLSQMLPLLPTIQARSPIEGKHDDDDNSTTRNSSNNGNNRNNRLQRNNMKQQALQAQRSTHYLLPTTYVLRLMVDEFDIKQSQFPTEKLVTRQIYCFIPDHEVDGCMSFSSICKCEWGTVIPLDCKQRKRYTHKILAIKPGPQQVKTIRKA